VTSDGDLLLASRREAELYRELVACYRGLADTLRDSAAVDPARVGEQRRAADALTDDLRRLALALAPHRLATVRVPDAVRAIWQSSAALAAEAAAANAEVTGLAVARRAAVAARLARVGLEHRALAVYRPRETRTAYCTDQRA